LAGRLAGRGAIVTGAADGLGRAASVAMAREGAAVLLVDIDEERLGETQALIEGDGGTAVPFVADVRHSDEVQAYVAAARAEFGSIDAFFNNAGVVYPYGPLVDYPEEAFDNVIAVNVRGVFLGLKYVLPVMFEQGSGAIVSTASMASTGGIPGVVAYVASKHAVIGLTKTAAMEAATRGVRVNAVLPGNIQTKMGVPDTDEPLEERIRWAASPVPQGRIGLPSEIADAVVFLVSDESRHITGVGLPVDGGITALVYPASFMPLDVPVNVPVNTAV